MLLGYIVSSFLWWIELVLGYFVLARIFFIRRLLGFLPLCRRISQDVCVMIGGGTNRCLWLGDNDVTLSMVKQAYQNFNMVSEIGFL
jgi:hypothetical protein